MLKILIAEPDLAYAKQLESDIKEWGYEVVIANNGRATLEALKNDEIRLALINWVMTEVGSEEICRQIRQEIQDQRTKNKYIILLTGKDGEYDIIRGLSAGADDYIIKPFNFLQLKVRLQNAERVIELEDSCIRLASFDALTKIWNKSKIIEILEDELNRGWRQNQPTGLIMGDIDHFKLINDAHGHFMGDRVLAAIAARFRKAIRPYDKVGRYGGDEMLIVLPNCGLKDMTQIAERLRLAVSEKPIQTEIASLNVTVSLGGTSSDNLTRASVNRLIQSADNALYQAKEKGRNCSVIVKFSSILIDENR